MVYMTQLNSHVIILGRFLNLNVSFVYSHLISEIVLIRGQCLHLPSLVQTLGLGETNLFSTDWKLEHFMFTKIKLELN